MQLENSVTVQWVTNLYCVIQFPEAIIGWFLEWILVMYCKLGMVVTNCTPRIQIRHPCLFKACQNCVCNPSQYKCTCKIPKFDGSASDFNRPPAHRLAYLTDRQLQKDSPRLIATGDPDRHSADELRRGKNNGS